MRSAEGSAAAGGFAPRRAWLEPGGPGRHGRQARTRGPARLAGRQVLVPVAWAAGTATAFAVYLRLAQTRAVNSDGAAQALQAWDMLHGNPLLRGWTTSDVSFYTTELPQYALVELVRGLRADVVTCCAAMTYTLVVLLAALVAVGRACGREAPLRAAVAAGIMLAPQLGSGTNQLLSSPDHTGTCVPLLLTWLALDRGGRRWYLPVITSALLCLADAADSIVLVSGIIPLALVCAARGARLAWRCQGREARYELAMAGGALAAAQAAAWLLRAVTDAGGFTVRPLGPRLAPLSEVFSHNLPVAWHCLLLLFGAYAGGPPARGAAFFPILHLAGVAFAAAGVAAAVSRPRTGDLPGQVLLAAVAVNLGAFLVTERAVNVTSAREIVPVLPFAAALAARRLSPWLARVLAGQAAPSPGSPGFSHPVNPRSVNAGLTHLARLLLTVVGAGYVAGLGLELTAPPAPPQAARLTAWLEGHDLAGSGLGGYWQASVVTLTSGGAVAIRPVASDGDGVGPHRGEVKDAWFDPLRSTAHFVVLSPGRPGYPGFADYPAVRATWGKPARAYHVGQYTIWYWPTNLLTTIRH